jgi:sugar lactone lactonase YvrE
MCSDRGLTRLPVENGKNYAVTLILFNRRHTDNLPLFVEPVNISKPVSDGLTMDMNDNIWITGVEHGALFVARPIKGVESHSITGDAFARTQYDIVKVVESSNLLRWPDGFSFGPDGLYVTASALHINFARLGGIESFAPFHILRLSRKALEGADLVTQWPSSGQ